MTVSTVIVIQSYAKQLREIKLSFSDSKTCALAALNYASFSKKKTTTKNPTVRYMQTTTIIHHHNMKGGNGQGIGSS